MAERESRVRGRAVALLQGGVGSEREVSLATGAAMEAALRRLGCDVRVVDAVPEALRALEPREGEVAVLALHGGAGEDGRVQGYLDVLGMPYTGSGVLGSALAMDKLRCKRVLDGARIPTPRWVSFAPLRSEELPFLPCVAKAASEGSSVGVHIVESAEDWDTARTQLEGQGVLVEEKIAGRELTVAVMDGQLLGVLEIRTVSGRYDYEAKYQRSDNEYVVLSSDSATDGEMVRRSGELGVQVYAELALSGVARVDVLYDERGPWVLEANTLPGMTDNSLVPKIAAEFGWDFDRLVEEIVLAARCQSD